MAYGEGKVHTHTLKSHEHDIEKSRKWHYEYCLYIPGAWELTSDRRPAAQTSCKAILRHPPFSRVTKLITTVRLKMKANGKTHVHTACCSTCLET